MQVLESAGVEPNEREVAKLERMADDSGEIERETFTAYAKKSEAFNKYIESERKSGVDKAEIAFKVNFNNIVIDCCLNIRNHFQSMETCMD